MCREEKSEQVRNFGADHIIDYRSESIRQEIKSIAPSGVDIVFDVVGGDGAIDLVKRFEYACISFYAHNVLSYTCRPI